MKRITSIITLITVVALTALVSCNNPGNKEAVQDVIYPLPSGAVKLEGFFENYIQHSINHWNKGELPYDQFADFFRNGRPQFALGEMWGKAVRSGSMFYRYTNEES